VKLAPRDKTALFVRIQGAMRWGTPKEAAGLLQALIAAGGDGYFARMTLGRLALRQKNLPVAEKELALAKRFDPERKTPYALLAATYGRAGKKGKEIKALQGLAARNQQSFRIVAKLTSLLAKANDWAGVRTYGEMAYFIDPTSVKLHRMLATAYEKAAPRPKVKRAIWHLETALLVHSKDGKVLHRELARLYRKVGQGAKAARHAAQAR